MAEFVFLKRFSSITEARLIKNLLAERGIISIIANSGVEFGGDLGDNFGADVLVPSRALERAKELIE